MPLPRDENGFPQRPADSAPLGDWKAYASELEAIAAAGERRANFVHQHLNELVSSPAFRLARSAKNLIGKRSGGRLPVLSTITRAAVMIAAWLLGML